LTSKDQANKKLLMKVPEGRERQTMLDQDKINKKVAPVGDMNSFFTKITKQNNI
jgi:hypothetical protein